MNGAGETALIVLLLLIVLALPIAGIIDAARRPQWAWDRCGENKTLWVVIMACSFVPFPLLSLAGIGASGIYFAGRRKKIKAAQEVGFAIPGVPSTAVAQQGQISPAGWYSDPWSLAAQRYWSGTEWTGETWNGDGRTSPM